MGVAGLCITGCRNRHIEPTMVILGNFEVVNHNGSVFAPKQSLYQKVAMGIQKFKM